MIGTVFEVKKKIPGQCLKLRQLLLAGLTFSFTAYSWMPISCAAKERIL